jgi:fanconi-associated nuclease 1
MLEALLTVFKKRTYAEYEHSRDRDIWPSRIELLDYEEALELELHLDELIDSKPDDATVAKEREGTATSIRARATPSTPGPSTKTKVPPLRSTKSAPGVIRASKPPEEEKWFNPEEEEFADEVPDTFQMQKSKKIVQYLDEWILERWKLHLDFKMETNAIRTPSLQRFEPGALQRYFS